MGYISPKDIKTLSKKFRTILQSELGQATTLGHCHEAIAEAFDFESAAEMFARLPEMRTWNRDWCINRLTDTGQVSSDSIARTAVDILEARHGRLIRGAGGGSRSDGRSATVSGS